MAKKKPAKRKCPYNNFFYPYNLGLGPRAQLMLLLYENITLDELYNGDYTEILRLHKIKINLLTRELPGLLTFLLPNCDISGIAMRPGKGSRMIHRSTSPIPQAINNLLRTRFPGHPDNITLRVIMETPQANWEPDFRK